jgi:hypothetical protein
LDTESHAASKKTAKKAAPRRLFEECREKLNYVHSFGFSFATTSVVQVHAPGVTVAEAVAVSAVRVHVTFLPTTLAPPIIVHSKVAAPPFATTKAAEMAEQRFVGV